MADTCTDRGTDGTTGWIIKCLQPIGGGIITAEVIFLIFPAGSTVYNHVMYDKLWFQACLVHKSDTWASRHRHIWDNPDLQDSLGKIIDFLFENLWYPQQIPLTFACAFTNKTAIDDKCVLGVIIAMVQVVKCDSCLWWYRPTQKLKDCAS